MKILWVQSQLQRLSGVWYDIMDFKIMCCQLNKRFMFFLLLHQKHCSVDRSRTNCHICRVCNFCRCCLIYISVHCVSFSEFYSFLRDCFVLSDMHFVDARISLSIKNTLGCCRLVRKDAIVLCVLFSSKSCQARTSMSYASCSFETPTQRFGYIIKGIQGLVAIAIASKISAIL